MTNPDTPNNEQDLSQIWNMIISSQVKNIATNSAASLTEKTALLMGILYNWPSTFGLVIYTGISSKLVGWCKSCFGFKSNDGIDQLKELLATFLLYKSLTSLDENTIQLKKTINESLEYMINDLYPEEAKYLIQTAFAAGSIAYYCNAYNKYKQAKELADAKQTDAENNNANNTANSPNV